MMLVPSRPSLNEQFAEAVPPFSLSKRLNAVNALTLPVIPFSLTAALSFERVDFSLDPLLLRDGAHDLVEHALVLLSASGAIIEGAQDRCLAHRVHGSEQGQRVVPGVPSSILRRQTLNSWVVDPANPVALRLRRLQDCTRL